MSYYLIWSVSNTFEGYIESPGFQLYFGPVSNKLPFYFINIWFVGKYCSLLHFKVALKVLLSEGAVEQGLVEPCLLALTGLGTDDEENSRRLYSCGGIEASTMILSKHFEKGPETILVCIYVHFSIDFWQIWVQYWKLAIKSASIMDRPSNMKIRQSILNSRLSISNVLRHWLSLAVNFEKWLFAIKNANWWSVSTVDEK